MTAPRVLFLDLGRPGDLVALRGAHEQWQDHGLGLLRTILHAEGIPTAIASTRACRTWLGIGRRLRGYDVLVMNVRSYTFAHARRAARLFKRANPRGRVLTGGMHAAVAPGEMEAVPDFDRICTGPGEGVIAALVREPDAFPRVFAGRGARAMADWPVIDRTLWPRPAGRRLPRRHPWPLEPPCGWGPGPVATMLTSRTCPWHCAFCNESAFVPMMKRRPVEAVIDELNELDRRHGPLGSVVFHDSLFFHSPAWLREWLELYPRRARRPWPYWAAARSDLVRRWPDLFSALVRETHWTTVSIGLESGSDRMLRLLNKECTEADNAFAVDLVNRLGDELEARGREPPKVWANVIVGIPGETREDAFKTFRLLAAVKRALPTVSYYAPYPGSALGYQVSAEGRSLLAPDGYHRAVGDAKVAGVDYGFYRRLLRGAFAREIAALPDPLAAAAALPAAPPVQGRFYLFRTAGGRAKLSSGTSPADAFEVLAMRLPPEELAAVDRANWRRVEQREIPSLAATLG